MFFRPIPAILSSLLVLSAVSCVSTNEVSSLGERSFPVSSKPSLDSPSHFICWNVHKAGDEEFTREVKSMLASIPKEDGVILCMQEVRSTTYDLIKGLHREKVFGHYASSWRRPFSGLSTGVLTIGNQPLPASEAVSIRAPHRELYVASPKVSLRTGMPLADGRTLEIINCHGLNFVPKSVFPKQLDRIFAELRDPDSPAIVCGDFNVWSGERLRILNEKAREAGLAEAKTRNPGTSPAPKWLRGLKRFNGFDPGIPLDRIYTRGIDVLDCRSEGSSQSSDHLPLLLRFKVMDAL